MTVFSRLDSAGVGILEPGIEVIQMPVTIVDIVVLFVRELDVAAASDANACFPLIERILNLVRSQIASTDGFR